LLKLDEAMDNFFSDYDAWSTVLPIAAAMLAAWGIGRSMGRRLRASGRGTVDSKFDDASLAILGLLLAFTFAMSLSKHEQRRLMVVADSNAIGDFYTCASLLKDPGRTELQGVIRKYAEFRLEIARERFDEAAFESALGQFNQMHDQMTVLVKAAVEDGTPIAVSLTNTLNGLTSSNTARLAAIRDRLPGSIVLLLFACAVISSMLVGREQGAAGETELAGTLSFVLLVTLAIYVTLDLNQPRTGLITVSQEPIQRLLSSMPR
jgi:hypothetical protein